MLVYSLREYPGTYVETVQNLALFLLHSTRPLEVGEAIWLYSLKYNYLLNGTCSLKLPQEKKNVVSAWSTVEALYMYAVIRCLEKVKGLRK